MPRLTACFALAVCLLGTFTAMADHAAAIELKPGDRIVFLGDSITQAGDAPGGYVDLVRKQLANDGRDVTVIGAGISGNKVPNLEARLDADVIAKKPTLTVIYIGINDVWHSQNGAGTPRDVYEAGLRNLVGRLNDAGSKVLLCTPSVIGEKPNRTNPLDGMLDEYCAISRRVAEDTGTPLLDLREAFMTALKEKNPEMKEKGIFTPDGVHLNDAGNRFVADQMLLALAGGAETKESTKMLRHAVLFKFKPTATKEQIQEVVDAFKALPSKIDTIKDFEYGTDVSVENKAKGFTHLFLVTFADEKGREVYLPHPAHMDFVKIVGPVLEDVVVVDYWAEK